MKYKAIFYPYIRTVLIDGTVKNYPSWKIHEKSGQPPSKAIWWALKTRHRFTAWVRRAEPIAGIEVKDPVASVGAHSDRAEKRQKALSLLNHPAGKQVSLMSALKLKKPFRTLHCYNSRYEHLDWDTTDFALWDTAIYLHWHKIKMHASLCCIVCMLERARNSPCFQGKCEIVCISCLGSLSQELHLFLKNEEKTQSDKKHAWKRASNT